MKPSETSADEWAEKCFKVESFFEPHLNTTGVEGCQSVDFWSRLKYLNTVHGPQKMDSHDMRFILCFWANV